MPAHRDTLLSSPAMRPPYPALHLAHLHLGDDRAEQAHALDVFAVQVLGLLGVGEHEPVVVGERLYEALVVARATGQAVIGHDHHPANRRAVIELARAERLQHGLEIVTHDIGFGSRLVVARELVHDGPAVPGSRLPVDLVLVPYAVLVSLRVRRDARVGHDGDRVREPEHVISWGRKNVI